MKLFPALSLPLSLSFELEERGELQEQVKSLAAKKWHHPISGQRVQFGLSTIERWFYRARNAKRDPVEALRRKIRSDHGRHPSVSPKLSELLTNQYRQHPNWSYQLHADNLAVLIEKEPTLGTAPSYASVVRFMKIQGLIKRPRRGPVNSPGARATEHRIESREIRSYESQYVNALWHLDFHHGSLRVLLDKGRWVYPLLLGIMDDHSRLCCHAQWYLAEGAEELWGGSRGVSRLLMTFVARTLEGRSGCKRRFYPQSRGNGFVARKDPRAGPPTSETPISLASFSFCAVLAGQLGVPPLACIDPN